MTDLSQALETAVGHHQAGRLDEAVQIYQQILAADPRQAHAMHLLGVVAHQRGQHQAAVDLISAAIGLEGSHVFFHNNLGEAHRACGNLIEARACYLRAIEIEPRMPLAYYNLALLHNSQGDLQAAADLCRQAVAHRPDYTEAHHLLARALRKLGDAAGAQTAFQRVLAIDPGHFEALVGLGTLDLDSGQFERADATLRQALSLRPNSAELHVQLGKLQAAQNRWQAAADWFQAATRLDPQSAAAQLQWAMALQISGQVDPAIEHYRRAIELAPDDAVAHYNLGTALELAGRRDEASHHFRAVLGIDPQFPGADTNLGAYHQDRGEFQRALAHYDRALAISPDAPKAHFNRALILLSQGDLAAAWPEFEWRLKLPAFPVQKLDWPRWHGEPIRDKTLLVHAEQGLGDTLQFIRYVPIIRQRVGQVVSWVDPSLVPLLRQSGFEHVVGDQRELSEVEYQVPIMSLPGVMGTTLDNVPAKIPYLSADPQLVAAWRERLGRVTGFRVGICWQGSTGHAGDRLRSVDLAALAPLAGVPGVRLVSLQKRDGEQQLRALAGRFEVHELGADWDQTAGPFMDTAAVMQHLDLVITVDTVVAHLAGALGVRVWVVLGMRSDWRWLLEGDNTPWYPTMRLFRQAAPYDWQELWNRVAAALRQQAAAAQGAGGRPVD